jgi:hypothetical protein
MGLVAAVLAVAGIAATAPAKEAVVGNLYVCNCGPDCKCNVVAVKAGKCKCGQNLVVLHALKVEGSDALLCTCGEKCKCEIDAKDPTKCGCGKPVRKVSLKATGVYFCNCGGACTCNTFSDKPAKCKCGMPLKRVD